MDGRILFAAALGALSAFAMQTLVTGIWVAAGAFQHAGPSKPARSIGFGMGMRALLGACIPLGFAAWLAANHARPMTTIDGALLGLAIWGGFMCLLSVSEAASRTSWFGAIFHVFRRSLGHFATPSLPSARRPDASAPDRLEAEVREAFKARRSGETLRESMQAYLERLSTRSPDRFEIDREANGFFADEGVRDAARRGDLLPVERNRFRKLAASRGDITAEESAEWADALHARWSTLREEGLGKESGESPEALVASATADESSPAANPGLIGEAAPSQPGAVANPAAGSASGRPKTVAEESTQEADAPEQAAVTAVEPGFKERLQAFKEFLRNANRSAFNPERLEQEVALLVTRNDGGKETVDREARGILREDVAQVLRQRRDLSSREADSIADLIDSARGRMLSRTEIREHRRQEATDQALAILQDKLYSLARPERDYGAVRRAIERLLEDRMSVPGAESEFREWDRAALQALFNSKQSISKSDADQMAESADAAFRAAQDSVHRLQAEIVRSRNEAILAAQSGEASARSLAASAGRWLAFVSSGSAAAAVLGGWLGARP